jgi:integrase
MARKLGRLRATQIAKLGPGRHHDGGGLYLVVGTGDARSWCFRFRRQGKLHDFGLGPAHTVTLAVARQRAFECRVALYAGNNPVEARKAKRLEQILATAKALTFEKAADAYIKAQSAGWRNGRSEAQWRQSLADHVFPVFGKMPIMTIDTVLVMKALEPIWAAKPETASRVRGRIEAVLDWATARGYRQGPNPAQWKGNLAHILPARAKVRKVEHHAALPYAEIGTFLVELRRQEGIPARALEWAILTVARTGEVLGARWDEIDPADRVWVVPAGRMKAGREHRVPLSDPAMQIIDEMVALRINDFVFPGARRDGGLGPMSLRRVMTSLGRSEAVHGFRSCFRDWLSETTAYPREVAEAALAHGITDKVEAAYRRGNLFLKRRLLMEDWATYCSRLPVVGDNIVAIGTAAP